MLTSIGIDLMETLNPPKQELEIDIIRYISALLYSWKLIIAGTVLGGSLIFAYYLTLPNIYEAFVRTAVVNAKDPGGIQPDERWASKVLALVEHGFVMGTSRDNYLEVMRTKLRTRLFTLEFMESHNVYQQLFAEHWDSDVVDMEKSIYRLIEAQTAIAMLANSRNEYAIEVIDPATMPFNRFSPAPRRLTVYGFVSGAMLACFFVIGRVLLTGFMTLISQIKNDPNLLVEGY
ncbi:MAG: hypothetical protein ACI82A_002551 [Candidatus Azotimanducaceae bacterium]|jgi:hypothetical protein